MKIGKQLLSEAFLILHSTASDRPVLLWVVAYSLAQGHLFFLLKNVFPQKIQRYGR